VRPMATVGPEFGLPPRVLALWFWQGAITAAALALPMALVSWQRGSWPLGVAALLLSVLLPLSLTLHGRAYARRFRCALMADGVLICRGVWWRSETFVPMARIQHTDLAQGPLARRFALATLKVFTAGADTGKIAVSDLAYHDALELRDRLLGRHDRPA
jgi:uncharacterized protein